jgi:hypothetical protein
MFEARTEPAEEHATLLWTVAVLIAALELAWWLFSRMYAS